MDTPPSSHADGPPPGPHEDGPPEDAAGLPELLVQALREQGRRALTLGATLATLFASLLVLGDDLVRLPHVDPPGAAAFAVFHALLLVGAVVLDAALARRGEPLPATIAAVSLALGVGGAAAYLQACWASGLLEQGAAAAGIEAAQGGLEWLASKGQGAVPFLAGVPVACALAFRRGGELPRALLAVTACVGVGAALVLSMNGRSLAFATQALLALAVLPTLDLALAPPQVAPAPPTLRARLGAALLGLVLPVVCFAANELLGQSSPLRPDWQEPGASTWWQLALTPEAQRPLYPLLLGAMLALAGALQGLRGPWVEAGLATGVVLAAGFGVVYLQLLPIAALMTIGGVGLLGFGPYLALPVYLTALRRLRVEAGPERPSPAVPLVAAAVLGAGGLAALVRQIQLLHAALPATQPARCFVASAAARACPRLTGSLPVATPGGTALVSPQLRALKAGELLLLVRAPRVHRAARAAYDRLAPPVAARLGPWSGAAVFVALLPAEGLVRAALRLALRRPERLLARIYPDGAP